MAYINKPKKQPLKNPNKNEAQRIYNTKRWKALRKLYIQNNPLCEICLINGLIIPAVDVHHKTPFSTGITFEDKKKLAFDYLNLQALCIECHKNQHHANNDKTPS